MEEEPKVYIEIQFTENSKLKKEILKDESRVHIGINNMNIANMHVSY